MKTNEEIKKEAIDFSIKVLPGHPHLQEAAVMAYMEGYSRSREDFEEKYKYIIR